MNPSRTTVLAAAAAAVLLFLGAVFMIGVPMLVIGTGALAGGGCDGDGGSGGGSQQIGPRDYNAEQAENAQTIVTTAIARKLPKRAAVIAISAAIVESQLRNLGDGDRDSLGLFQQRPSQGWGSPEQILNPAAAAGVFYDRLLAVPGWATQPPGQAAQTVQRSAFPGRYGPQEEAAAAMVDRFWQGPDNPIPTGPPAGAGQTAQQASTTLACPNQGGAGAPLGPSNLDPRKLPPNFALPTGTVQKTAVSYALAQLGKPYVWGAKGPDAFDCSGLMLAAWAAAGVPLPAGTTTQKSTGTPSSLAQVAPGDLLFIPGSLGSPTNPRHVGMYVGGGLVVNAYDSSTGVVLQPLADWQDQIVAVRHIAGPAGTPTPPSPPGSVLAYAPAGGR